MVRDRIKNPFKLSTGNPRSTSTAAIVPSTFKIKLSFFAAVTCSTCKMLVGKQMQFFGARANLAKCLLYALNGGRDELTGKQVGPASEPVRGDYLEFDDVAAKFERMMEWLAGVYVNAMNVIHYMHDKYSYERIEMALHDYAPVRTM